MLTKPLFVLWLAFAVPDKAIDLVDEACANARVQLDSVPEDIDQLQRQKYRLQVEEAALSKEKDKVKPLSRSHSEATRYSFLGMFVFRYQSARRKVHNGCTG